MDKIEIEDEEDDSIPQELDEEEDIDGWLNEWILSIEHIAREKYVTESTGSVYEKNNFHYLPSFSKSFLKFLKTYPLWSAIMTQHYNVNELTASSANVESYFNDLKNRSFHNDKLPIRADKFVCKHMKEIEGMFKLFDHDMKIKENRKNYDNLIDVIEKNENGIDLESENPAEIFENWRGLGKKKNEIFVLCGSSSRNYAL